MLEAQAETKDKRVLIECPGCRTAIVCARPAITERTRTEYACSVCGERVMVAWPGPQPRHWSRKLYGKV